MYSESLSTIATVSSVMLSQTFPASFYFSNIFNPLQNSLGLEDKNFVFHSLRDPAMIAGDLSNLKRDLSLVFSMLQAFASE